MAHESDEAVRKPARLDAGFEVPALAFDAIELHEMMRSEQGLLGSVLNVRSKMIPRNRPPTERVEVRRMRSLLASAERASSNEDAVGRSIATSRSIASSATGKIAWEECFRLQVFDRFGFFHRLRDEAGVNKAFRALYALHSRPSTFGNLDALQTEYDASVRRSRDMLPRAETEVNRAEFTSCEEEVGPDADEWACDDEFEVSEEPCFWTVSAHLCERLGAEWRLRMKDLQFQVRVEPSKLVLYDVGDFFQTHRDTPDAQLIGSIVLGLCDTSTGGGLVLEGGAPQSSAFGDYCFFRPDVVHEVKPVEGGHRAVLTFKVYADPNVGGDLALLQAPQAACTLEQHDVCLALAREMDQLLDKPRLGFLLSHQYARTTTALLDADYYLMCAATHLADAHAYTIPVKLAESKHGEDYPASFEDEDCDAETIHVYSLENEVLERIRRQEEVTLPACGFYALGKAGLLFARDFSRGGNTGNECEESRESCIYVHRALIIERRLPSEDGR